MVGGTVIDRVNAPSSPGRTKACASGMRRPSGWIRIRHLSPWESCTGHARDVVTVTIFPGCGSDGVTVSSGTHTRAGAPDAEHAVVVGSPFAYLLEMEKTPEPPREGTIFYPFHGWEGQEVMGDHRRLIAELKAHETGPVTVCLYWNEHRVKAIRQLYESAGFRVICHGYRGFWWRNHDRDFLVRQLAELRRHQRVVSNRLCSAIWYGLLAGCQAAVYGDPMVLDNADPTFGGEPRLRRQWPEVYGYDPDPLVGREIATVELGADVLASPDELRAHLGWPAAAKG